MKRARGFRWPTRDYTSRDDVVFDPARVLFGEGAEQRPNVLTCGAVSVRKTQPPWAARGALSIVLNDGYPAAAEARVSFRERFLNVHEKKLRRQKQRKHSTRAANRRGACTTKKRTGWLWRRLSYYAASQTSFVLLKDAKGSRAKNLRSDALTFLTKRKRRQRRSHVQSHVYSHTYRHTYHPTNALSRCALHHREPSSPRAFEPSSVVVVSRGARRIFLFPCRPVFRVFRVVSDPTQIDRRFGSRARDLRGEHVRDCLLARVYLRLDPLDGGGGVGLEPRGARGRVADARA